MILGHCTTIASLDRQKYDSGMSERRTISRETESAASDRRAISREMDHAANYGAKHMPFESMDLSSGERSNARTPSSESR